MLNIIKNKVQTLNFRNNFELRINFLSKTFLKFLEELFLNLKIIFLKNILESLKNYS